MDDTVHSNDHLCKRCTGLFEQAVGSVIPDHEWQSVHFYNRVNELYANKNTTACPLCTIVAGVLIDDSYGDPLEHLENNNQMLEVKLAYAGQLKDGMPDYEVPFSLGDTGNIAWVIMRIHAYDKCDRKRTLKAWFLRLTFCVDPGPPHASALWTTSHTTSSIEEKHAQIKQWFTRCETSHVCCRDNEPRCTAELPKRLVKILGATAAGGCQLVLCSEEFTEPTASPPQYAALSYCWGGKIFLQTTKNTLSHRMRWIAQSNDGISTSSLVEEPMPPTFHDAVSICRSLGIEYIWIDSLCIIQDDGDDWGAEAARMKDIYAGAALTIAASSAEDCLQGCFPVPPAEVVEQRRETYHVHQLRVPYHKGSRRENKYLHIRISSSHMSREVMENPLSRRGWTLQEQVLSRRIVHCTYPEIHWQCGSLFQTELGVVPSDKHLPTSSRTLWRSPAQSFRRETNQEAMAMHESWTRWIEDYSSRSFTVPKDKLAALSEIVEQFSKLTGFTHLIGCWEETIGRDLSWIHYVSAPPQADRSILPGIPSWCWLSRNHPSPLSFLYSGAALYDGSTEETRDHVHYLDSNIVWDGHLLLSELRTAELEIEGMLKNLAFDIHVSPQETDDGCDTKVRALVSNPSSGTHACDPKEDADEGADVRFDGMYYGNGWTHANIYTCLLLWSRYWGIPEGVDVREAFLILERVQTSQKSSNSGDEPEVPSYRRIGFARVERRVCLFDGVKPTILRLV